MDSTKVPIRQLYGPATAYVDPDEVLAFALAVNDDGQLYLEAQAAPPTYAVVPTYSVMFEMFGLDSFPPEAMAGSQAGVHGEHDLYLHKPVEPGMHLHSTAERCSVVTSKAGMNIVAHIRSVDDAGELVVEQYWSSLFLGDVTGGDHGTPPPDHSFPDDAHDRLVGTVTLATTRDQPFRYAGASADRGGPHVNDEVARSFGFPRKFNQGLCTLGVVTRGLVDVAAYGDPGRVRRIAVRFASPVFPGEDIEVAVYDIGLTADGAHAYAFEADSAGAHVLRHGRLEVAS